MNVLSMLFRLLGTAVSVYMLLCVARIILTWFPMPQAGGANELIGKATEPYLAWWRRIPWLRAGGVDFSPIVALAVLSGVSRMLTIASYGALTIGLVLSLVVEAVWAPISFLLGFFMVLVIARIVAYVARWNSLHPVWRAIDSMINPVLYRIQRWIYRDRIVNYVQGLATGAAILLGARVGLGLLVGLAIRLLSRI